MIDAGVDGIEFVSVNTDAQALMNSKAPIYVRIGDKLTKGLGAGGRPEIGERAAEESADTLRARWCAEPTWSSSPPAWAAAPAPERRPSSPSIARAAGALTVGVVTKPFDFEGTRRRRAAEEGIAHLRETRRCADHHSESAPARSMVDPKTPITEAFSMADDVLRQGIGGISDLITKPGVINLDFADVKTIMKQAGSALMAIGHGTGETRCIDAAQGGDREPAAGDEHPGRHRRALQHHRQPNLTLIETSEAAEIIRAAVDEDAEIIYGTSIDESLGDAVMITLIATGFDDRERVMDFQQPVRRPGRQQQAPPPQRSTYRGGYNDQAARAPHQSPILPDDEFDEESSIIRFLRER